MVCNFELPIDRPVSYEPELQHFVSAEEATRQSPGAVDLTRFFYYSMVRLDKCHDFVTSIALRSSEIQ